VPVLELVVVPVFVLVLVPELEVLLVVVVELDVVDPPEPYVTVEKNVTSPDPHSPQLV
jgi:hypothetical protein